MSYPNLSEKENNRKIIYGLIESHIGGGGGGNRIGGRLKKMPFRVTFYSLARAPFSPCSHYTGGIKKRKNHRSF